MAGPKLLESELEVLKRVEELGLPVPKNFGKTTYPGLFGLDTTAVIQERMVASSKDFIKWDLSDQLDRLSPLNERTIKDLEAIKRFATNNQIRIQDMQFLVGWNGHVVINDPMMPVFGVEPDLRQLEKLMEVAQRALELRGFGH